MAKAAPCPPFSSSGPLSLNPFRLLPLPPQEFSGDSKGWTLDRMELNCLSSYVPAPAFYVGTPSSGMVNGATVAPLADCEYDVIITTSDIPGTGTVGGVTARLGTCPGIGGQLCACLYLLSQARHLPGDFGDTCVCLLSL